MKKFLGSVHGKAIIAFSMVMGALAVPALAGATTYDPTSDATNLADGVGTTAGPVIVAVATGIVGLVILLWAVKFIFRLVKRG